MSLDQSNDDHEKWPQSVIDNLNYCLLSTVKQGESTSVITMLKLGAIPTQSCLSQAAARGDEQVMACLLASYPLDDNIGGAMVSAVIHNQPVMLDQLHQWRHDQEALCSAAIQAIRESEQSLVEKLLPMVADHSKLLVRAIIEQNGLAVRLIDKGKVDWKWCLLSACRLGSMDLAYVCPISQLDKITVGSGLLQATRYEHYDVSTYLMRFSPSDCDVWEAVQLIVARSATDVACQLLTAWVNIPIQYRLSLLTSTLMMDGGAQLRDAMLRSTAD